jgi:hypothetical protein
MFAAPERLPAEAQRDASSPSYGIVMRPSAPVIRHRRRVPDVAEVAVILKLNQQTIRKIRKSG